MADRRPSFAEFALVGGESSSRAPPWGGQEAGQEVVEAGPAELLSWARRRQPKMAGGMVCVAPRLYLGNKQAAADRELLRSRGIVAVCAVGARQVHNDDLAYHHVSIADDGQDSMLPHFEAACQFIRDQRERGSVLVHCKGGISRSPTLVAAYLMSCEHLSLAHAVEVCCLARPAARPREVFLQDLEALANALELRRLSHAISLATLERVERLAEREVSSWEEACGESQRLLAALEAACTLEAFGEQRAASDELRAVSKAAVSAYAKAQGWTKFASRRRG